MTDTDDTPKSAKTPKHNTPVKVQKTDLNTRERAVYDGDNKAGLARRYVATAAASEKALQDAKSNRQAALYMRDRIRVMLGDVSFAPVSRPPNDLCIMTDEVLDSLEKHMRKMTLLKTQEVKDAHNPLETKPADMSEVAERLSAERNEFQSKLRAQESAMSSVMYQLKDLTTELKGEAVQEHGRARAQLKAGQAQDILNALDGAISALPSLDAYNAVIERNDKLNAKVLDLNEANQTLQGLYDNLEAEYTGIDQELRVLKHQTPDTPRPGQAIKPEDAPEDWKADGRYVVATMDNDTLVLVRWIDAYDQDTGISGWHYDSPEVQSALYCEPATLHRSLRVEDAELDGRSGQVHGEIEHTRREVGRLKDLCQRQEDDITRLSLFVTQLQNALTPSGATKAAYSAEFKFPLTTIQHDPRTDTEYEDTVDETVPWTVIKDIMAAIYKRAADKYGADLPELCETIQNLPVETLTSSARVTDAASEGGQTIHAVTDRELADLHAYRDQITMLSEDNKHLSSVVADLTGDLEDRDNCNASLSEQRTRLQNQLQDTQAALSSTHAQRLAHAQGVMDGHKDAVRALVSSFMSEIERRDRKWASEQSRKRD